MKRILFFFKRWFYKQCLKAARKTYRNEDTTGIEIKLLKLFDFINKDMSPKQCSHCGHTDFYDIIEDRIDNTITEKSIHCKKCEFYNGYWAYGYYIL